MPGTFVARAAVTIDASGAKVWDALVNPETIKHYMPVTDVVSEWREGSAILWKSEFQGKPFEGTGTVLRVPPGRLLQYDHFPPLFPPAGARRAPVGYQRVTVQLSDE